MRSIIREKTNTVSAGVSQFWGAEESVSLDSDKYERGQTKNLSLIETNVVLTSLP